MHMAKCYSHLKREVISHLHGILSAIPCSFVIEVKYRKNFFFLHFTVSMKDIAGFNQLFFVFFKKNALPCSCIF